MLIAALLLTGCTSPIYEKYHPHQHPGSKWVSEDGRAWFVINSDEKQSPHHSGALFSDGKEIKMVFEICMPWDGISAVPKKSFDSVENEEDPFSKFRKAMAETEKDELWSFSCLRGEYIVCKIEVSSVFEKGEEITFFRVA